MGLYGRRRIYSDIDEINKTNIVDVLTDALIHHEMNAQEISYLRWYVRGKQPILDREKRVRRDVCNKTVENVATEVLDFKLGYIWGKPVNTIRAAGAAENADVSGLIDMYQEQRKADIDQDLALDLCIGGIGYRGILNNPHRDELAPFCLVNMRPETTFCIYKNDVFQRKLAGVSYIIRADGSRLYSVYTEQHRFELDTAGPTGALSVVSVSPNGIGTIPIVEFTMPESFGVFEKAVPLLDALNTATSNRLDDVEQAIQSILWAHNTELDKEELSTLEERLAIMTRDTGDGSQAMLKYLSQPLDQTSVQALVSDLQHHVLEICGVPGRESSAEATGSATEMGAAGWKKAQYSAERIVAAWNRGERDTFRVVLSIFARTSGLSPALAALKLTDLDTQFTLSKNNNILTKTQGLLNMLQAGVHPRIAYRECDLFSDPENVYRISESDGHIARALSQSSAQRESGDVTNQPEGEDSMTRFVQNKGSVQKPD